MIQTDVLDMRPLDQQDIQVWHSVYWVELERLQNMANSGAELNTLLSSGANAADFERLSAAMQQIGLPNPFTSGLDPAALVRYSDPTTLSHLLETIVFSIA